MNPKPYQLETLIRESKALDCLGEKKRLGLHLGRAKGGVSESAKSLLIVVTVILAQR